MNQTLGADFARLQALLPTIQQSLADNRLGGWLLYDLHARNNVAVKLVGQGDLTRRYFVFIPAAGEPTAISHGIEEPPWQRWPWRRRSYIGWRELTDALGAVLDGAGRVAMEFSDGDAMPAVDLIPAGVVELVRSTGVDVVSSADLITRFYSAWTRDDVVSHRRAAETLAGVARVSFEKLAQAVSRNEPVTEGSVREAVVAELQGRGFGTGAGAIVATGTHASNPHYEPANGGAAFRPADVVLIDLWAKESVDSVFADQTWMAYLGATVPDHAAKLFGIVCDARDAAVAFIEQAWREGRPIRGGEVDDIARGVITDRGYGAFFIHRTGHSIDRSTHGMGPNIDNYETHDVRLLVAGIGFSIEPGIYVPGELGVRTEINVYVGEDGPEVTTPAPQREMLALLPR